MEKLRTHSEERQFDLTLENTFNECVALLTPVYADENLDYLLKDSSHVIQIENTCKDFLQFFRNKEDIYTRNTVEKSIHFAYDLAGCIYPPGTTISPYSIFKDVERNDQTKIYEVAIQMSHIKDEYLQHRQHLEATIQYFLPYLDPEDRMSEHLETVIAYLLLHVELYDCDQYIDSELEQFKQSKRIPPDLLTNQITISYQRLRLQPHRLS